MNFFLSVLAYGLFLSILGYCFRSHLRSELPHGVAESSDPTRHPYFDDANRTLDKTDRMVAQLLISTREAELARETEKSAGERLRDIDFDNLLTERILRRRMHDQAAQKKA